MCTKQGAPGFSSHPHLPTLVSIVKLLASNNVLADIRPFLSACRFIALHKDEADLSELRPIGVGSTCRRFLEAVLAKLFKVEFTKLFAAHGQFVVGVKGGVELLHHLSHAQCDSFVDDQLHQGLSPAHALVSVDFVNFFNRFSRSSMHKALHQCTQLSRLVPCFDLMHGQPNRCCFVDHNGLTACFNQEEGVVQGGPMSPILACLAITPMLED